MQSENTPPNKPPSLDEILKTGLATNVREIADNLSTLIQLERDIPEKDPKRRQDMIEMWRKYYHIFNQAANRYRDLANLAYTGLSDMYGEELPSLHSQQPEGERHSVQPLGATTGGSAPDEPGNLRTEKST